MVQALGPRVQLRKVTETKHVVEEYPHGDPERRLYEAVKVKPGLPWRTQNLKRPESLDTC